ncbi:ferric reductase-like transmembrane domain-containing protein [Curtobacterium pusillum]|uniref:ferredoxin reductase family protein n=1 Tax=Curtobacterium pusillum TaxID=69373 RepID=UPI0038274F7A
MDSSTARHTIGVVAVDGDLRPGALATATALTLAAAGALAVSVLAVVDAPKPLRIDAALLAHLAGLLAGWAVTVMVFLMARVPVLERSVGADRMARWHGKLGPLVLVLVLVHGTAATISWAQAQVLPLPAATAQVVDMPGLVAATVATAMFVAVAVMSARAARRRMRYETWHAIHLGTYVAIALSFVHELAGPDLAGRPVVQVLWSTAYTIAFAALLRYRVLSPLLQATRHRLRVEQVVQEGPGTVSVVVRGAHLEELAAEPGQFFRWRFLTRATWPAAHPFSLSAPVRGGRLRLTVRAVGDGTRLVHALRPGVAVLAEGPYGAMTERRRTRHGVLLIAGGVGITPMRTLFESLRSSGGPLTLVYRVPRAEDLLFRQELEQIAAWRPAHLVYLIGPSSDPRNAMTAENLRRIAPDVAERDVFMCAGPALARAARTALRDAGVPERRIHHEEFAF